MKQLALAILDWMITAIFLAGIDILLLVAYFGIKEEIRHRNAVAELKIEYAQAIHNLQVR